MGIQSFLEKPCYSAEEAPLLLDNPDECLREYTKREKEYLPDCVKYSKALPNPFITKTEGE